MNTFEIIEKLKSLPLNESSIIAVKDLLRVLGKMGSILYTLNPGKVIMRARANDGNTPFYLRSDLTYLPTHLNSSYKRASGPNFSMFYGSIISDYPDGEEIDMSRIIGIVEADPWLRDPATSGTKHITFGKWVVTSPIHLLAIIHEELFHSNSPHLFEIYQYYKKFIESFPELRDTSNNINQYLAKEFSKDPITNEFDYLISASMTELIIANQFDGVFYPSVQAQGRGFNIAITPFAADSNLHLQTVGHCIVNKKFDKTNVDNYKYSILYPHQTSFIWQDFVKHI